MRACSAGAGAAHFTKSLHSLKAYFILSQVFPVSSIIAASAGYAVGLVLTVPIALYIRQLRAKQQRQRPATDWDD